jgi:hypothetical protein
MINTAVVLVNIGESAHVPTIGLSIYSAHARLMAAKPAGDVISAMAQIYTNPNILPTSAFKDENPL